MRCTDAGSRRSRDAAAERFIARRWTKGVAELPSRARLIVVDLDSPGHYWRHASGETANLDGSLFAHLSAAKRFARAP
jgi:hypothetical protein